jgi:hypothetical protein
MVAWTRILVAAGLLALAADCSSPTTTDPHLPVGALVVACPANVTVSGASGTGQVVTYPSPTQEPIQVLALLARPQNVPTSAPMRFRQARGSR